MIRGYEVITDKLFIDLEGKIYLNNPSIQNDADCICWCELHTNSIYYAFYGNCTIDKWVILKAIKETVKTITIDEIMKNICESCDEFSDWYELVNK